MRLWDRLRQKDRIEALQSGLGDVMVDAGVVLAVARNNDEGLVYAARSAVQAVVLNRDGILATVRAAEELKSPFTPTHIVVFGTDESGKPGDKPRLLVMGSARIDGLGAFETRNLGVQPITTPGGVKLRLPQVAHVLTVRFGKYTMVRGKDRPQALADLIKHEPGLRDVLR